MPVQKRAAAIHDISCFGRCSLTVALPILSAAGIECSVIPTAVLSTHTGGFTGYTFNDLSGGILPIAEHWKSLNLSFDAIYTGYLASFEQIDAVSRCIDMLKNDNTLIIVDPVMADNGELYSAIPNNLPEGMRRLCAKADIIVPNMTEAALLLNEPYLPGPRTEAETAEILRGLAALGPGRVVLTGVSYDGESIGAACYDGRISCAFAERIDGMFHGTGDVFASVLTAALLRGKPLDKAAEVAVKFTSDCVRRTKAAAIDERFGLMFEEGLAGLRGMTEG